MSCNHKYTYDKAVIYKNTDCPEVLLIDTKCVHCGFVFQHPLWLHDLHPEEKELMIRQHREAMEVANECLA